MMDHNNNNNNSSSNSNSSSDVVCDNCSYCDYLTDFSPINIDSTVLPSKLCEQQSTYWIDRNNNNDDDDDNGQCIGCLDWLKRLLHFNLNDSLKVCWMSFVFRQLFAVNL